MTLPQDILNIICDFLHCDLIETPIGPKLELRPCHGFEIKSVDGKMMVFPCTTQ